MLNTDFNKIIYIMKKITFLIVSLAMIFPSIYSQDEDSNYSHNPDEIKTIFDNHGGNGGYGAFTIGYTKIDNRDALLMGGRGEWVIGHGFGLGIAGYGFMNDPLYDFNTDLNYALAGGYGGLIMEPILFGWFPVHISIPILIGAGGVANTSYRTDWNNPYEYWDGYLEDASAFFVAEPGVELEFNLVRFMRLAVYSSYRYTTDIQILDVPPDVLQGFSYGITFKFGSF